MDELSHPSQSTIHLKLSSRVGLVQVKRPSTTGRVFAARIQTFVDIGLLSDNIHSVKGSKIFSLPCRLARLADLLPHFCLDLQPSTFHSVSLNSRVLLCTT